MPNVRSGLLITFGFFHIHIRYCYKQIQLIPNSQLMQGKTSHPKRILKRTATRTARPIQQAIQQNSSWRLWSIRWETEWRHHSFLPWAPAPMQSFVAFLKQHIIWALTVDHSCLRSQCGWLEMCWTKNVEQARAGVLSTYRGDNTLERDDHTTCTLVLSAFH